MMHLAHSAVLPEVGQDIPFDHRNVARMRLWDFARKVLRSVAFPEVLHRRRVAQFTAYCGRVLTAIDTLTDCFCFLAGGRDRPVRPRANPVTALTLKPVRQIECACALGVRLGRRKDAADEAGQFTVPFPAGALGRRLQSLDEGLGEPLWHGLIPPIAS